MHFCEKKSKKIKKCHNIKIVLRKKVKMNKKILEKSIWKNKDKKYLFELQKFLDLVDNIEDENLRKRITNQMLKCDRHITNLAEEIFKELIEK